MIPSILQALQISPQLDSLTETLFKELIKEYSYASFGGFKERKFQQVFLKEIEPIFPILGIQLVKHFQVNLKKDPRLSSNKDEKKKKGVASCNLYFLSIK